MKNRPFHPSNVKERKINNSKQRKIFLQGIFLGFVLGAVVTNLLSNNVFKTTGAKSPGGPRAAAVGTRGKSYDESFAKEHIPLINVSAVEEQPGAQVEVHDSKVQAPTTKPVVQEVHDPVVVVKTETKDKLSIAVVMCINSKTMKTAKILEAMSISKLMLPSLQRTIEPEKYNYTIYLGMDDDDNYWMTPAVQKALQKQAGPSLPIIFRAIPNKQRRIPFNEILQVAYDMESDYMVRINDDSEFKSGNWTTYAVNTLVNYDPPNLGVVGPTCAEGNDLILTHDMVHRTHMEVHKGEYYPGVFSNWWLDDWITFVYVPRRMTKLENWVVKHHTSHHGTRYKVVPAQERLLAGQLQMGKARVTKYLIDNNFATQGESMASQFDILLTVNEYTFEAFLNWWAHYIKLPDNSRSVVYIVAQDKVVHDKLTKSSQFEERRAVIEMAPVKLKTITASQHYVPQILRHLRKGRNVLYCDVDVIWKSDPFLHFPASPIPLKAPSDVYISVNAAQYENHHPYLDTAFMAVWANSRSVKFVDLWSKRLATGSSQGMVVWNDMLTGMRGFTVDRRITHTTLPRDTFPSGTDYSNSTSAQRARAVVVHNNYVPDSVDPKNVAAVQNIKKKRLVEYGLWEPVSLTK